MKRFVLLPILFYCAILTIHAQSWSGIIAPARAIDWTQAGIPGGLPDGSWTQCGVTIPPYSGSDSTISNALAACGANQYVLLAPGTFNINSQINFPANNVGHVVLRGSGANSTFIITSGGNASIRLNSNDGTYRGEDNATMNIKNWTGGYAKGATQITLSDVSGIVANQSMLVLNQCDTGFSGQYCLTGTATDNNAYFICATPWTSTGIGCNIAGESPDGPSWRCQGSNCGQAWQEEVVLVTAINAGGCGATCVTISHPLHSPNWASGQYPVAIVIQGMPQVGVENLSIDGNNGAIVDGISTFNTYQAWVSGIRVVNMQARGIDDGGSNTLIQNNYVYGNPINYNDDTGIHCNGCANEVAQNNIIQWPRIPYFADGPNPDSVIAYNYSVNAYSDDDQLHGSGVHSGPANNFNLWEGNIFTTLSNYDSDHGGHMSGTFFRNFYAGWESCANGNCGTFTAKDFNTHGPEWDYASRYQNVIGNVWGTPGYHTIYSSNNRFDTQVIYEFGGAYGSQPFDPLVQSTSMLWGNWDVVTNATRWCGNSSDTGWSTTCGSASEVPTGAPTYPNPVPSLGDTGIGQGAFPASFYLSTKPSWFGSIPWPVIGPDVSGGNVGQCGGTLNVAGKYNGTPATSAAQCAGSGLNAAWAGHVNAVPAMACAISMGIPPDGTGAVKAFDPNACYGGGGTPTASLPTFSPSSGAPPQTVTIISSSSGAITCYNTTGSPSTNGTTGCTSGTLVTGTVSVSSAETLYAVAGGTGYLDSAVSGATYVASGTPTFSIACPSACSSFNFGGIVLGSASIVQTFTVSNTGTAPLIIALPFGVTGGNAADFAPLNNQCATSFSGIIAASTSCIVQFQFTPSNVGPRSTTLTFTDNASGSPHTVALTGTGIGPPPAPPTGLIAVPTAMMFLP